MSGEPVDLAWLGGVLGVPVTDVEISSTGAFNSRTSRLTVEYAEPADRPRHLVLKRNDDAEWAVRAGRLEAAYYLLACSLDPPPPGIVRALAAGVDRDTGDSFVLLPDLSDTHAPPLTRDQQIGLESVPAPRDLMACVTALARHHAYWWRHPALASGTFERGLWTRDDIRFAIQREQSGPPWRRADLPDGALAAYDAVLDGYEGLWGAHLLPRLAALNRVTLTHGDAYFANFLCPRGGEGTTYLVDWQGPLVDHPGTDVANLLATFWTREQRQEGERERRCLRTYLAVLEDTGVEGYGWDDLVTDYRLGLLEWLLVPIHDAASGSAPSYWIPKLSCLLDAVSDWDCLALLP